MNREGIIYMAGAGTGFALAFAANFLAVRAGQTMLSGFELGMSVTLVVEFIAALALTRPLLWRLLCVFFVLPLETFLLYGNPSVMLAVFRGEAPSWVAPGIFLLFGFLFVLTVATHFFVWRFFVPRVAAP